MQKTLFRVLFYLVGLLFMAFGVAFSVNSNLGVSPVNSLPYVVSLVSGFDMGVCVVGVFVVYIFVQFILLRKEFKLINLVQILFSTAFGWFVDFAKTIVGDFAIPTYFGQLLMLAISIVLIAIGVCMYLGTNLMPMPMEGMTAAIAKKLPGNKSFHDVKVVVDCVSVGLAAIISLVVFGQLLGVREGTVICALLVGQVMKPIQKILTPIMKPLCFGKENAEV